MNFENSFHAILRYTIALCVVSLCLFVAHKLLCALLLYVRHLTGAYLCFQVKNNLRQSFRALPVTGLKPSGNHSHGAAATTRSAANSFIDKVIDMNGYIPFSISMSKTDQISGNHGNRYYYWPKDLATPYRNDKPTPQHIAKLVDVDYYVDMSRLLTAYDNVLLYTFSPRNPSGSVPNGTYSTTDNIITMDIAGGATYTHALWQYNADHVYVRTWWGAKLFMVETKETSSPDHVIVSLFLAARYYTPLAWLLPESSIQRRQLTFNGVNVVRSHEVVDSKIRVVRALSLPGSTTSVVIPEEVAETAMIRCDRAKDPSISDIERIFREYGVQSPTHAASLFMLIYGKDRSALTVLPRIRTKYIGNEFAYQAAGRLVTEDGKQTTRDLGFKIYPLAVSPKRSENNDASCIKGRIQDVKNRDSKLPPFYHKCITEFIGHILDKRRHFVAPCLESDVEDRQTRPTQRALAARSKPFAFLSNFTVKSFIKAESYAKVDYPRNISTVPTEAKLRYGSFVYPLMDICKQAPWYAFGKHPRVFSDALHHRALGKTFAVCTDYSKFDGTHGAALCQFEEQFMMTAYDPRFHDELLGLMRNEQHAKCYTSTGISYDNGYSRLSGSMSTSLFNTIDNALVSYIAYRSFMESDEAYRSLGLYGGDDGVNFDLPTDTLTRVVEKFGLSIKVEKIEAGSPIPFLGRVYLDPWTNSRSICDVKRQISKFHLTASPTVVPEQVCIRRKCDGYLITDPHTPVISQFCKRIIDFVPSTTRTDDRDYGWWAQYDDPYDTPGDGDEVAVGYVLAQLGIDNSEYERFLGQLAAATSLDAIKDIQLLVPKRDIKITAALGDNLVKPPTTTTTTATPTVPAEQRGPVAPTTKPRGTTTRRTTAPARNRGKPPRANGQGSGQVAKSSHDRDRIASKRPTDRRPQVTRPKDAKPPTALEKSKK